MSNVIREGLCPMTARQAGLDFELGPQKKRRRFGSQGRVWLDDLPEDVCLRIALHVSEGARNKDALRLAQTSEYLRDIVLRMLSCCYKRAMPRGQVERSWAKLFMSQVQAVDFRYLSGRDVDPVLLQLLTAATVRQLCVIDSVIFIQRLPLAISLRELYITVFNRSSLAQLFDALAKIALQKLSISCQTVLERCPCAFKDETYFRHNYNAITASCPNLSSLTLKCKCLEIHDADINIDDSQDDSWHPMWVLLPQFHSLREVQFERGCAPHDMLMRLQALDAVHAQYVRRGALLAKHVGASLQTLETEEAFTADQIAILSGCPRLSSLACKVIPGAEKAFADVVPYISRLRKLDFDWNLDEDFPDDDEDQDEQVAAYPWAAPGALPAAVSALGHLEELHLTTVRVPLSELRDMLKSIGERLISFRTSICTQDESPRDRLCGVLCALIEHNGHIRNFELHEHVFGDGTLTRTRNESYRDLGVIIADPDWENCLDLLLDRLRRCAPGINSTDHFNMRNFARQ